MIYYISQSYSTESPFFYGFAENKETEISHDADSYIEEILVTQGQSVKAGDILVKVSRSDLKYKEKDNAFSSMDFTLDNADDIAGLEDDIARKQSQIIRYKEEIDLKLQEITIKEKKRISLLKALESVEISNDDMSTEALQNMASLRSELSVYQSQKNEEIDVLKREIVRLKKASELRMEKISSERKKIDKEYEKLDIKAPANGVIGNIPTKRGENIKAYSTLLTFYEENPTLVKGYVHESLILQVNKSDVLKITSSLRPENVINGEVVGLGSRIVEIPERLRKNPAIKSYGREVLVKIPSKNNFLQKEKVSINSDKIILKPNSRKKNQRVEDQISKELKIKK